MPTFELSPDRKMNDALANVTLPEGYTLPFQRWSTWHLLKNGKQIGYMNSSGPVLFLDDVSDKETVRKIAEDIEAVHVDKISIRILIN